MKEIALIAPMASMLDVARRVLVDYDYDNIEVLEGNLETGVEEARRAINAGAKVIISRGGTYKAIKAEFEIPVVEVKVTAFDLIEGFKAVKQSGESGAIGVIGYENIILGADIVAEVMGLKAFCYKMSGQSGLTAEVDRLIQQGVRVFLGDANVQDATRRYGCLSVVIESGPQAMQIAFENARATLLETREEERTLQVSKANKELTQAVETLKRTQSILVETEKIASLGRLVAGVAHELNTPIGNALIVISGGDDLDKEVYDAVVSGQVRKSQIVAYIERMREGRKIASRSLMRAAEIIQDFKQLSVDQTSAMRRSFDLYKVVDEMLSSLRPRYKHTPYIIEADLEAGILMDSYPGPLGQVLTNIAMNALAHAFEGRDTGVFRIIARRLDDATVSIVCSDDGVGMDEETLHKVYDPFFSTKMGQGGSGLGLHIVHTLVTGLLNGQIEVRSQPGQGTCFSIVLPCVLSAIARSH